MKKSADRYISIRALNRMRQICNPLNLMGIIEFTHDLSFPKGEISILSTQASVFRYWFNHRTPAIRTDENGRAMDEGIYLSNVLTENFIDCSEITPVFNSLCKSSHHLSILKKDLDCQHLFTFSVNKNNNEFTHWAVNNIIKLQNFVEFYQHSAQEIISEAKKPENRIQLPIINNDTNENQIKQIDNKYFSVIHKDTKIPIFLSKQQGTCLKLLIQGKSAKQIGFEMQLSYRTVQHYAARIKKLLNCSTNKELIIFYGNQLDVI